MNMAFKLTLRIVFSLFFSARYVGACLEAFSALSRSDGEGASGNEVLSSYATQHTRTHTHTHARSLSLSLSLSLSTHTHTHTHTHTYT
jgi:hypothetical protein